MSYGQGAGSFGCSPFFISDAFSTILFGEMSRNKQLASQEEKTAFGEYMRNLRSRFDQEKFDAELRFKREMLEAGRFYLRTEAKKNLENERKKIEFEFFQANYWPLNLNIWTVWNLPSASQFNPCLTVILARYNSPKAEADYTNVCDFLRSGFDRTEEVRILSNPWNIRDPYVGGMAQLINIHYILRGIPTLVLAPQLLGEKLNFNIGLWTYGKGTGSFFYRTLFSMDYKETDYDLQKEKIRLVLLTAVGLVRDNFMLFHHQAPVSFPETIDPAVLKEYPDLGEMLLREYRSMETGLLTHPSRPRQLFTESEISRIADSFGRTFQKFKDCK